MNAQHRHYRSAVVMAATIALFAAVLTSTRAQDIPIFRERTDLVQIDVTVTDRDGRPVRDLSPAEFEVMEDGRTQDIQAFSLIDLQADAAEPQVGMQTDVVTNTAGEGRVFVMLLDVPSTASPPPQLAGESYSIRVKQVALRFVDAVVGPRDQVAVVHAQGSFSDAQPFTTNRRLMLESIDRYGRGVSWAGVTITDQS